MPQRQEAVQNSLGGCRKGHPSRKCCWSGEEGCGVPAALSSWSPFPGHKGPGRHGHTVSLATARTHGRNRSMTPRQSAGCHKSLGEGPGRHTAVGKASLSWTHRPCGQGSLRRTPGGGAARSVPTSSVAQMQMLAHVNYISQTHLERGSNEIPPIRGTPV